MDRRIFPKIKFKAGMTLTSQIFDYLRHQIVAKKVLPGTALSENELAAHFEVSRQPVHEALNKLAANGLIEIIPQKGTYVSRISVSNVLDICFVRCAIECQSVRKSVKLSERVFNKIVGKLQKNLEQQRKWHDKHEPSIRFLDLDDVFHRIICEFSQTELAWDLLYRAKANMDRVRYLTLDTLSDTGDLIDTHAQILQYIENKQVEEASELLERHAFEIASTYKTIMKQNRDWFDDGSQD